MTDEEKFIKLKTIYRHALLLKARYGFKDCPEHLKETFAEVKAALLKRVDVIQEG